jgi:LPXTG-motif cell wall-anchored protein
MSALGDFFVGLGDKVTGKDSVSQSVASLNNATATYLGGLATQQPTPAKGNNSVIVIAIVGSIVLAGGVAFFMLKKKKS